MRRKAWVWLEPKVIRAIHEEQLAEHGGIPGIRDESLLDSALARPINLAAYGAPTLVELAAAYGHGIARNHAFLDGNKRTAFVAVELFLALNGAELVANDVDCVMTILQVSAGEMAEAAFAEWIARNTRPIGSGSVD